MADIGTRFLLKDGFTSVLSNIDRSTDNWAKRTQSRLGRVAKAFVGVKTAIASIASGVGVGLIVQQTVEADLQLSRFSQRLGFTVEQLSALRFAAGQTGTNLSRLVEGLRDAQQRLVDFAETGGGEARGIFGLVPELQRASEEGSKFEDVINALAAAAQRLSAEQFTFVLDELGSDQLLESSAFFKLGAEGIKELRKEAEGLGLIIDENQIAATRNFKAELERLKAVVGSIGADFSRALLPAITSVLNEFRNFEDFNRKGIIADAFGAIQLGATAAIETVQLLLKTMNGIALTFDSIKDGFGSVAQGTNTALRNVRSGLTPTSTDLDKMRVRIKELNVELSSLYDQRGNAPREGAFLGLFEGLALDLNLIDGADDRFKEFNAKIAETESQIANIRSQIGVSLSENFLDGIADKAGAELDSLAAAFRRFVQQNHQANLQLQAQGVADAMVEGVEQGIVQVRDLLNGLNADGDISQGLFRVFEQTRSRDAFELVGDQFRNLNRFVADSLIPTIEEYGTAAIDAAVQVDESILSAVEGFQKLEEQAKNAREFFAELEQQIRETFRADLFSDLEKAGEAARRAFGESLIGQVQAYGDALRRQSSAGAFFVDSLQLSQRSLQQIGSSLLDAAQQGKDFGDTMIDVAGRIGQAFFDLALNQTLTQLFAGVTGLFSGGVSPQAGAAGAFSLIPGFSPSTLGGLKFGGGDAFDITIVNEAPRAGETRSDRKMAEALVEEISRDFALKRRLS